MSHRRTIINHKDDCRMNVAGGAIWLAGLLLVALLCPGTAAAEPPAAADSPESRKDAAKQAFERGLQQYNKGNYPQACADFERSVELHANISNRGKLAECYEQVGRVASAWRLYQEVAKRARGRGDDWRADVAEQRVRTLQPRLSRLLIVMSDPEPPAGLVVTRAGQVVEPRVFGGEQILDPGSYRLVATAPGYVDSTQVVQLDEGATATATIPALTAVAGDSSDAASGRRRLLRYGSYTAMGAGVVGLALSVNFGNSARTEWNSITEGCLEDPLLCAHYDYQIPARVATAGQRANYSAIAGVALLAGGAIMWWASRDRATTAAKSALRFAPSLGPEQLSVVLSGSL